MAFSVFLIVMLEWLSMKNRRNGGIILASNISDISPGLTFAWNYLPTIIAVCYSMIWTWIDLDVKRLEPYFQMSKSDGVSAANSLLLDYPFDFVAFVPIKAARRRHWSVFCAGTAMVIIFWVITPLQSAVFSTSTITRSAPILTYTSSKLLPVSAQSDALDGVFLTNTYGILWLDQKLPSFTTKEYVLAPFGNVRFVSDKGLNQTRTAPTLLYSTDLSCHPANISNVEPYIYSFSDNRGCETKLSFPMPSHGEQYSLGYYSLSNTCSAEFANNTLAVWSFLPNGTSDWRHTAVFCETSYYYQAVNATVNMPDDSVVSVSVPGPKIPLRETQFNYSAFETVITDNLQEPEYPAPGKDYATMDILELSSRLKQYDLVATDSASVPNIVGFALGGSNFSIEQYSQPANLHAAFEAAHRLLFVLAFNELSVPSGPISGAEKPGMEMSRVEAVVVVRTFAILVECFLVVIIILSVFILLISSSRASKLCRDPNSISSIMALASGNCEILELLKMSHGGTTTSLEKQLEQYHFRIAVICVNGLPRTILEIVDLGIIMVQIDSGSEDLQSPKPMLPLEMRWPIGSLLLAILLSAMVIIVVLYVKIIQGDGLPRPSNSTIVRQILLNYLPTAFSTFLEPFLVVLNRLLCILQPFEALRRGRAKFTSSLGLQYTSLPPQLIVWRATRAKDFVLVSICGIAILANLFAVALSGLFTDSQVEIEKPLNYTAILSPHFNDTGLLEFKGLMDYPDHFYVADSNISQNTPLLPWMTQDFFFIPFDLQGLYIEGGIKAYKGLTRGFGADVSCVQLNHDVDSPYEETVHLDGDGQSATFSVTNKSTNITCVYNNSPMPSTLIGLLPPPDGRVALEMMTSMDIVWDRDINPRHLQEQEYCQSLVAAGWVRWDAPPDANATRLDGWSPLEGKNATFEYMAMVCQPQLKTAVFEIIVDSTGRVMSASQSGDFDQATQKYFSTNESALYIGASNLIGAPGHTMSWHNISYTLDWMNYLIKMSDNSSAATDPEAPVPEFSPTAKKIEQLYRLLFAILLGLNQQVFDTAQPNERVSGALVGRADRIFMSKAMFYIAISLLGLDTFVIILYYSRRPRRFLPRMPTNIASTLAYVAASHAITEIQNGDEFRTPSYIPGTMWTDETFSFGSFVGTDGKPHIGIERDPLVLPLGLSRPKTEKESYGGMRSRNHVELRRLREDNSPSPPPPIPPHK
ncbi:MAG: hypothetical protein M1819_005865 [Sarea resinae]|nr:MAG: hypothetical protein M1819_005865 [Sarea resinae]